MSCAIEYSSFDLLTSQLGAVCGRLYSAISWSRSVGRRMVLTTILVAMARNDAQRRPECADPFGFRAKLFRSEYRVPADCRRMDDRGSRMRRRF